jgi:hypothetical protein
VLPTVFFARICVFRIPVAAFLRVVIGSIVGVWWHAWVDAVDSLIVYVVLKPTSIMLRLTIVHVLQCSARYRIIILIIVRMTGIR